jgi:hypothetical protein
LPLVESAESALAVAEIGRWQRASIRRFTVLKPSMRLALMSGLKNVQDERPSPRWADILEKVRRS